jgi:hypothetical protein
MALPPITGQGIGSLIKPQEALESDYSFATNRPQSGNIIRDELVASQGNDPIINKLEAYQPSSKRGSREKPLIMKYPVDMGRGEIPHVMQFKAFWRWENPEFRQAAEKLKKESENTLKELVDATNLVNDGNFNVASLSQQGGGLISETEYANAYKLLMDPAFANPSNPSNDNTLSDMLSNPETREEARRQMERNVRSATDRVESIQQDFGNPKEARLGASATEITKDPDFLDNRFNKQLSGGALSKVKDGINSLLSFAGLQLRDPQYDQMVSIYLPVCTRINGEDAFSYTDANMAIATGAAAAFNTLFGANGVKDLGGRVLEVGKQAALAAATNSANGTPLAGVVPAVTGLVLNPRIEKMFSQKELRNFSFSWELYPRNQDEVNTIKNIIDTFRYHSHPARTSEGGNESNPQIMLRVPAEFTIKFLSASGTRGENGFVENEYIPKISRCVLTGIGVDYTPNGVFSTLPDNSPTGYVLTLSFSEIAQLTRQDVEVGY